MPPGWAMLSSRAAPSIRQDRAAGRRRPPSLGRRFLRGTGQTQFEALQLALQLTRRGHCGLDNRYGAEVESRGVT